jgi:uncharacterized protein (DUF433 family)
VGQEFIELYGSLGLRLEIPKRCHRSTEKEKYVMWEERIVVDPKILVGKPIVKGTRLAVEFMLDLLAQGWSPEEILHNYPGLEAEDIQACLAYARDMLRNERVYLLEAA